ncbi:MAG: hypothetical protein ABH876_00460 [Patescibacteria group bacterium]|nr:hypothetical protein [Patescibacteria group bacterium]MBU1877243.1 hypothetical protein [Patescibacteria group bacterium]
MRLNLPKDEKNILWTNHVKGKLIYYQLSEKRIKRVLRNPNRIEKGIADNTLAVMQIAGTKKHQTEIWVMYQTTKSEIRGRKIRIISAWRYPGTSPKRESPLIPQDALEELARVIKSEKFDIKKNDY